MMAAYVGPSVGRSPNGFCIFGGRGWIQQHEEPQRRRFLPSFVCDDARPLGDIRRTVITWRLWMTDTDLIPDSC